MCVNYTPPTKEEFKSFDTPLPDDFLWPKEAWQDYAAPIIIHQSGSRTALLATYGMVPKRHIPPHVKKYSTLNARSETIGTLRSYSKAWKSSQLCLVPMTEFFEPNWQTGEHIRWSIGMSDLKPFAVAGLWRSWEEPDGTTAHSFTQLTINADNHPVMKNFHKPDDEKRSLVIIPSTEYDEWLDCKNPEIARTFLNLYPPELMACRPAPKASKVKSTDSKPQSQTSLL